MRGNDEEDRRKEGREGKRKAGGHKRMCVWVWGSWLYPRSGLHPDGPACVNAQHLSNRSIGSAWCVRCRVDGGKVAVCVLYQKRVTLSITRTDLPSCLPAYLTALLPSPLPPPPPLPPFRPAFLPPPPPPLSPFSFSSFCWHYLFALLGKTWAMFAASM
jgi:hypothetical protein